MIYLDQYLFIGNSVKCFSKFNIFLSENLVCCYRSGSLPLQHKCQKELELGHGVKFLFHTLSSKPLWHRIDLNFARCYHTVKKFSKMFQTVGNLFVLWLKVNITLFFFFLSVYKSKAEAAASSQCCTSDMKEVRELSTDAACFTQIKKKKKTHFKQI